MTDCTCQNCRARKLWAKAVEIEGGNEWNGVYLTIHLIGMAGNHFGISRDDLHVILDMALAASLSISTVNLGSAPKVH